MLESVRRHTSLLLAVSAIAVLAASQVSAQEEAGKPGVDQGATGPAGINADTVDGRHAKGAAATPTERAGQLVATNAAGYLPNDIIAKAQNADTLDGLDSAVFARAALLRGATGAVNEPDNPVHWNQLKGVPTGFADGAVAWSEVANKPAQYPDAATLDGLDSTDFAPTSALGAYATTAALASDAGAVNEADNPVHWKQLTGVPAGFADGQVGWGEVGNMPAGFADGVDNEGVTGVTLTRVAAPEVVMAPGAFGSSMATCPTGSRVTGGGFGLSWEVADFRLTASAPFLDSWVAEGVNDDDVPIGLGAYALCLKVEPAEAFTVATQGVVPTSVRKDIRSRDH